MAVPISTKGPYAALAPTGTTQATAALITADTVKLTGGTSGMGVRLDAMDLNQTVWVYNADSTKEYFVYPQVGGSINGATTNLGVNIPPNSGSLFRAINNLDVIWIG